jgi:glutamine synthetase
MLYTESEVLQFCEENDVKFVKLMFCDIFGNLKTISILAGILPDVFREGLSFHTYDEGGFSGAEFCDLKIFPDPDTLAVLPWRPQHGRVVRFFCHVRYEDNTAFVGDGRFFLKNAVDYAAGKGYNFRIGTSCEFYCFTKDENDKPTAVPLDLASYCDAAPNDRGENLRRDI